MEARVGASGALEGKARAKINLNLRVLDRRPDGYHNLDTLFARIDLHDTVVVAPVQNSPKADGIEFAVHGDAGGADDHSNLAYRAAVLLREATGRTDGLRIQLTKRIPTGAGLGGGSADAATTLKLVNTLWGEPLDKSELLTLAGRLGADVPFLTTDFAAAFGKGRGDDLDPATLPAGGVVLLALPDVHVGTADAYDSLAAHRVEHGWLLSSEMSSLDLGRWEFLATACQNDFEGPVHARFAELRDLHRSMSEAGAFFARMSGSGAAHFAVFDDPLQADAAAQRLLVEHPTVRFVTTRFA